MIRKIIFLCCFCLVSLCSLAGEITISNYKGFIGKKIKFADTISKGERYKIANKKFKTKAFAGKTLVISNIELDKRENLVLLLTMELEKGKTKEIKVKTKTQDVELENIKVIWPKIKRQVSQAKINRYTEYTNHDDFSGVWWLGVWWLGVWWLIILLALLGFFCCYIFNWIQDRKTLEEITEIGIGEKSEERLILMLRNLGYSAEDIYHNLYIPLKNGNFSQIDLLLLTSVGIIVFEVKDYSGWIFGKGNHNQWTQVLNYGKEKHRFYNPIKQNEKHISNLKNYIGKSIPCFSVIVFYGNSELKDISFIPKDTYIAKPRQISNVIDRILAENRSMFYDINVKKRLSQAVEYGRNDSIKTKHIENIKDMKGEDRLYR